MVLAGFTFAACKNDKHGETGQSQSPAQQDTTAAAVNTPPPPANEIGALEAQRWRLVRFVAEGATVQLSDSAHITAFFDGTFVTGSGGCNDYRANYKKDGATALKFSELGHSSRNCKGLIGREQKYFAALLDVGAYEMPDSLTLEMKGTSGNMTFRAIHNGLIKYVSGSK